MSPKNIFLLCCALIDHIIPPACGSYHGTQKTKDMDDLLSIDSFHIYLVISVESENFRKDTGYQPENEVVQCLCTSLLKCPLQQETFTSHRPM